MFRVSRSLLAHTFKSRTTLVPSSLPCRAISTVRPDPTSSSSSSSSSSSTQASLAVAFAAAAAAASVTLMSNSSSSSIAWNDAAAAADTTPLPQQESPLATSTPTTTPTPTAPTATIATSPTRIYTRDEINAMLQEDRIVVYYKCGVYDATDFSGHPGGVGRLEMAAGGDLEVYWSAYTQHNRGHVVDYWLDMYKIGEVTPDTMAQVTAETFYDADAVYGNEPEPYPDLLVNTRHPLNCEGKLADRTDSFITPIGKHFVRNHNAVPEIDPEEYTLTITGEGITERVFSLQDLKTQFDIVHITTVIQCNGNRREDFHYLDGETPAFGPPHWVAGAIGNCTWTGVRLRDLLKASGLDVDAISLRTKDRPVNATQIGLLGYDHDECGNQYCCSFPFDKAIDPYGDVIVAFQMNGEDIPRPYGYPGKKTCLFQHTTTTKLSGIALVFVRDCDCCCQGLLLLLLTLLHSFSTFNSALHRARQRRCKKLQIFGTGQRHPRTLQRQLQLETVRRACSGRADD